MRTATSRALFGAFTLTALSACGATTDFEIREIVSVDSAGGATIQFVDLRAIAGDAWSERDKIDDVTIKSASATIVEVGLGNTATSGSGTATLRRSSAPTDAATFAEATDIPIQTGSTYDAVNLSAVSGVVKRALNGDGQIEIVAEGSTSSGVAQFDAEIVIKVEVKLKPF
jgi:hypothetical protein